MASGDVISLTVYNSDLGGGSVTESYTAQTGDTLFSIADALATAVNLDPLMQAVGQTAKATADAHFKWSQSFAGNASTQPGGNDLSVSATDGANNTHTSSHQISANSGTSLSWIYDVVGNFSYGPNQGYSFDPENRFQQLDIFTPTTPGTYYDHDALGRCVAITTYENAIVTSRKIYVWSGDQIIQEQDDSGNVTKDYFAMGETRGGGINYFYSGDHLGSIRELTDASGNIQAQYSYDSYGRSTKIQGLLDCDFQYAGYFYEPTSGFNLTRYRAYSSNIGRWISRDPIEESIVGAQSIDRRGRGLNVFAYVDNSPILMTDGLGLAPTPGVIKCPCGKTFFLTQDRIDNHITPRHGPQLPAPTKNAQIKGIFNNAGWSAGIIDPNIKKVLCTTAPSFQWNTLKDAYTLPVDANGGPIGTLYQRLGQNPTAENNLTVIVDPFNNSIVSVYPGLPITP